MQKQPRLITREVLIGGVGVGASNPIRIQSMTTTDTKDVKSTVDQIMRLSDSGCEIVRMTVQGMKEAESCEQIKNILQQKGYTTPLVADIHFYPAAAMRVVEFVDKIRINPGNFVDKRAQFIIKEYDEKLYLDELKKIEDKFLPLVLRCKELSKALRIGTNHGSLSDRIMNRFGDSPLGMVESAIEYALIARSVDFHNMVFSMKSSNPKVMIAAYRLLVQRMKTFGWDYPLHLGVTEAGEGEDGRIKSAVGIGTLLSEGIGDTIRVSLTEDPWQEIIPAKKIVAAADRHARPPQFPVLSASLQQTSPKLRRGAVIALLNDDDIAKDSLSSTLGLSPRLETSPFSVDAVVLASDEYKDVLSVKAGKIPIYSLKDEQLSSNYLALIEEKHFKNIIESNLTADAFILYSNDHPVHFACKIRQLCKDKALKVPLLLTLTKKLQLIDVEEFSTLFGSLLIDGIIDGIAIEGHQDSDRYRTLAFSLMQSCRLKTVKTEFISCPGCGRTLFDLQEVNMRIKKKTAHLPGVKIAVMGCIVNGPGEMVDADFGYVGSRPGKIDLYVAGRCVEKNIDLIDADDRLVELIKREGRWIEP